MNNDNKSDAKPSRKPNRKQVNRKPVDKSAAKKDIVCNYEKNLRSSDEELEDKLIPGKVNVARNKGELELSQMESELDQMDLNLVKARQDSDLSLTERASARMNMEKTKRKLELARDEFKHQFN